MPQLDGFNTTPVPGGDNLKNRGDKSFFRGDILKKGGHSGFLLYNCDMLMAVRRKRFQTSANCRV